MYGIDFEFANRRLSDFGCIMCHINTSCGTNEVEIGCDITFNTVKNNHSSIHSITSSSYENVYTTTFEIMKYSNADDIYMTSLEVRALTKWLNRREYAKLRIINELSDESDVSYYGSFNVTEIVNAQKIMGLSLTFTSNAPYGFASKTCLPFMIMNPGDTFELCGDSDELGVIYPTISIKTFISGDVKILMNDNEENYILVSNCSPNETITIDGEHKIITTDNNEHEKTLPNDFNYNYFEILIDEYNSINKYEVSAPCEIIVYYSPIRKVGVY